MGALLDRFDPARTERACSRPSPELPPEKPPRPPALGPEVRVAFNDHLEDLDESIQEVKKGAADIAARAIDAVRGRARRPRAEQPVELDDEPPASDPFKEDLLRRFRELEERMAASSQKGAS